MDKSIVAHFWLTVYSCPDVTDATACYIRRIRIVKAVIHCMSSNFVAVTQLL